jgi:hypothetical protein
MLTLQKHKNPLAEKIKPVIKYLTSIDFGKVSYENEVTEILKSQKLNIISKTRIQSFFNPLLWVFRIFVIETEII